MKSFSQSLDLFFSEKKLKRVLFLALFFGVVLLVYLIVNDRNCGCHLFADGVLLSILVIIFIIVVGAFFSGVALLILGFFFFILSRFIVKSAIKSNVFFPEDVLWQEAQKKLLDEEIRDTQDEIDSTGEEIKELEGILTSLKHGKIDLEQKRAERFGTHDL